MPATPLPAGTPSEGYYINDEDRFAGSAAQLLASLLLLDTPDDAAAAGWVSRSVAVQQLLDFFRSLQAGNALFGSTKIVINLAGRDALDPLTMGLETECILIDPLPGAPKRYRLQYTPYTTAGCLTVWRDGYSFGGQQSTAQWVDAASPLSLLREFSEDPTGYVYAAGDLRRGYVSGATEEQIFRRTTAGAATAPTDVAGNADWEHVNAQDAPQPNAVNWPSLIGDPADSAALMDLLSQYAGVAYVDATEAQLQSEIDDLDTRITQAENDADALDLRVDAAEASLFSRLKVRGAWAANTLYAANDVVTYLGTPYYRTGAAFTSGSSFDLSKWTAFGIDKRALPNYQSEIVVDAGYDDSFHAIGGQAYAISVADFAVYAVGPASYGRVDAYRNTGTGPVTITAPSGTTIDGAASLVLPAAGDAVWLKAQAGGYAVVLDARKATGGGGGAGIDYANPITLSAPTTLASFKAYHLTGTGYTLTLPTGTVGDLISVNVDPAATGVYTVGPRKLISGELMEFIRLTGGWTKKTAATLPIRAAIKTAIGDQSALIPGDYKYLNFTGGLTADSTPNLPGLLKADGKSLVVQRDCNATVTINGVLENLQNGGTYAIGLNANAPGMSGNNTRYQIPAGPGNNFPGLSYTGFFAAGTELTVNIFASASGNLRGTYAADPYVLQFIELLT
ncbi:hypothetical protein KB206_10675 [Microvirga sp. STS02]|uniref:hypothetical protein n=1 Tax=Hymenobacter negativus TaxID=2795026 RepID=UPI0018DAFABA|nr:MULTISPECIES: hypothetical protein [Bacteria]MBH8569350.1 hypothetical protein [Hymenobacter negativus]MBR7209084.1 hypothetical protein [Microvirga sp. STS02]